MDKIELSTVSVVSAAFSEGFDVTSPAAFDADSLSALLWNAISRILSPSTAISFEYSCVFSGRSTSSAPASVVTRYVAI